MPKFWSSGAGAIEEGAAVLWSAIKSCAKQLLDGLFLAGHDPIRSSKK
ncbi:hypothetical protein [Granulicella sp. L60]|nr:hypothetical protein [Granulicella sp. L60]